MSEESERGLELYRRQSWDSALEAFDAHLNSVPDDPHVRALSSVCQLELGDDAGAETAAHQALQLNPDEVAAWLTLARLALREERLRDAENSVQQALRRAPTSAPVLAVAATLQLHRERWPEALALAEQGLAFEPQDRDCMRVRARVLLKMRRIEEGRQALRQADLRSERDPLVLAEFGWSALERGERERAVAAFVASLRADPQLEWAREGLAESLPPPFPFYRQILRQLLRLQRYRDDRNVLTAAGEMMLARAVEHLGRRLERLKKVAVAYMVLRALYMYFTWVARPVTNFLLLLHPMSRPSLDDDQRGEGTFAGIGVTAVVLCLAGFFFVKPGPSLVGFFVSMLMISVLSATYDCKAGWPRQVMGAIAVVLLAIGLFAFVKLAIWFPDWTGWDAFSLFVSGTVLADLASFFLRRVRPSRRRSRSRVGETNR